MFLEISNNNGTRYIRVSESIRKNVGGKRVTRKRVIKNVGPVSRFDDGKPDFEGRLKRSYEAGEPIINELQPYLEKKKNFEQYTLRISEHTKECIGHPKLFSNVIIESVMKDIGLDSLLENAKRNSRIKYDVKGFVKLLLCGRIMNPTSKYGTLVQNKDYYSPLVPDGTNGFNIYDTLDFIYKRRRSIFSRINRNLINAKRRNPLVIFYDVTNFFFEIERPDKDTLNEDGDIVEKGLRKVGVSKENRKTPIVQMGLFMDDSGIPISFEQFPGNTLDNNTVKKAMASSIDRMDFSRFIFIGDRGMCSSQNLSSIVQSGNGYIVSKSVLKSSNEDMEWIYDPKGYTSISQNFKYKSIIRNRVFYNEHGEPIKSPEKVVVFWDKRYYNRQVAENKSMMDFLESYCNNPARFRIGTIHASSVRPYLKHKYQNLDTGELLDASRFRTMIDYDKIEEEKKAYGYYQIITSEIEKTDREIIDAYHGLTRIEDQFRVMKSVLDTRPIFVRRPEHIEAHLALCVLALIIIRITQLKILDYKPELKNRTQNWSFGLSAERIQRALNKFTVEELADEYYRFNNVDDEDLKLLLGAFGIDIPTKLFTRSELRSMKKRIVNNETAIHKKVHNRHLKSPIG